MGLSIHISLKFLYIEFHFKRTKKTDRLIIRWAGQLFQKLLGQIEPIGCLQFTTITNLKIVLSKKKNIRNSKECSSPIKETKVKALKKSPR
jgi:hypothetical protein